MDESVLMHACCSLLFISVEFRYDKMLHAVTTQEKEQKLTAYTEAMLLQ